MEKTIFWDFDGTLTYAPRLWSTSIYNALKKQFPKSSITFEEVRRATSGKVCTWDTHQEDYSQILGGHWWRFMEQRFFEKYMELGLLENSALAAAKMVRGEVLDLQKYHLYEDTVPVLEECLARGYHNYVLSNNYPEMDQVLEGLSLLKYFEGVIVSAKVGCDKPSRKIFEIALQEADNPSQCCMIGDNPVADMQGAKQVGMKTILVHKKVPCGNADVIIETLSDIFGIPGF